MSFDFESLLAPLSLPVFRETYNERQPLLHKRAMPAYYDALITLAELDAHIGRANLKAPGVRLVRNGKELDGRDFSYAKQTVRGTMTGVVDKESLFAHFNDGYTIVLNAYERHSANMFHLCHTAERVFEAPVQANIYISPRDSQGLRPHWDTHDVFVLQFAGVKEWTIYSAPEVLPSRHRRFHPADWQPTEPLMEAVLEPGDLLYLPRGYVHKARATAEVSAHVTLGVYATTYADLLLQIVEDNDADEWLRQALPPGFATSEEQIWSFITHVIDFISDADVPASASRIYDQFANRRLPDTANRLLDYVRLPALGPQTRLRRKRSVFFRFAANGERVTLTFNNKEMSFPAAAHESLRFIIGASEFQPQELPDNIDAESKLVLCRSLVREGFLTIAGDS